MIALKKFLKSSEVYSSRTHKLIGSILPLQVVAKEAYDSKLRGHSTSSRTHVFSTRNYKQIGSILPLQVVAKEAYDSKLGGNI